MIQKLTTGLLAVEVSGEIPAVEAALARSRRYVTASGAISS